MALPIVYRSPENSNVATAKKVLKERAEESARRREARANAPVPNYICYATTAFKNWKPGDKVPPCKKCGGLLHPGENHKCDGFQAKYYEYTPERKERWEAEREEIRDYWEDGQIHWDEHEGRPVKAHRVVDAEPDGDLDGYEDEPEEDYCEGDDDGYDCD